MEGASRFGRVAGGLLVAGMPWAGDPFRACPVAAFDMGKEAVEKGRRR